MASFYQSGAWKRKRKEALRIDRNECQRCRAKGIYTKATTVHHVNHVKDRPDLALEMWYTWNDTEKRNLISLCHECHEAVHGYRMPEDAPQITEERWD